MSELALCDEHGVEEFLNLWVVGLRIGEDLADEVHQPLNLEGMALLLPFHDQRRDDGVWSGSGV